MVGIYGMIFTEHLMFYALKKELKQLLKLTYYLCHYHMIKIVFNLNIEKETCNVYYFL